MSESSKLLKPIETRYHGFKFRSRLEARWAVFFDTLSVGYRYEPEGFFLEGIPYLPDFYLPQQDCFVEIKGQQPTAEEVEKIRLLALYTGKNVSLLFGDVWLPYEPTSYKAYLYSPPKIYAYRQGKQLGEESPREVEARQEVKVVLQKLYDQGITIDVRYGLVTLRSAQTYSSQEGYSMQTYLASLQQQYQAIAPLAGLIQEYNREIMQALTSEEGWLHEFYGQMLSAGLAWAECTVCGDVSLLPNVADMDDEADVRHQRCPQKEHGWYFHDSPRLTAAYTAARQARF